MQVASGPIGHRKVRYEAPPAARLPAAMDRFLAWFAAPSDIDPLLTAGLAHIWFLTIHPIEDGNGRIARAIGDIALARSEQSPQRFYSMSAQTQREPATSYTQLERTQKGGLDSGTATRRLLFHHGIFGQPNIHIINVHADSTISSSHGTRCSMSNLAWPSSLMNLS